MVQSLLVGGLHIYDALVETIKFGFPDKLADPGYISYCFGDKLHPTENGYKNLYVPGMLSAIV